MASAGTDRARACLLTRRRLTPRRREDAFSRHRNRATRTGGIKQSDRRGHRRRVIPSRAKRSCRVPGSRYWFPSIAIVPLRRPRLPEHAAAAGPSSTLAACKRASIASFSKRLFDSRFSGIGATRGRRGRLLVPSSGSTNSRSRRASPRPECLQERCEHSVLGLATSGFRPDWRPRPASRRMRGSRSGEHRHRSA